MAVKRKVEDWTVEELDKARDRISFPEYQREKSLWSVERKALLMDSILKDFDIPKLYFNRLKDGSIEVIDGQQRLWALWEFLDDAYKYSGDGRPKLYSQLSVGQREAIQSYSFQVTVFNEAGDDYLRDLFLRLQWGLLLNTGEKLHAATGKMKTFVWKFAGHNFIKALGIPDRRYARQTLAAQIALNVFTRSRTNSFARTRYEDLMHFFAQYEDPKGKDASEFNAITAKIIADANGLWKVFGDQAKTLKSRSYILSVYLFYDEVSGGAELSPAVAKQFSEFTLKLIKRVREEAKLGIDRKNRELYSFETLLSSAPTERYQIERRHEKLIEYFAHYDSKKKIKGD